MKKNISDVLDYIEYNPLKTKADKSLPIERIKQLTMDKVNNHSVNAASRPMLRRFAIIAIAAMLLVALPITAYATNAFRFRDSIAEFFGKGQLGTIADDEKWALQPNDVMPSVKPEKSADESLGSLADDDKSALLPNEAVTDDMLTLGWPEALKSARIAVIEYYKPIYANVLSAMKPVELSNCEGHYTEEQIKDEWAAFLVPLNETAQYILLTRINGGEWEIVNEWH
jgi:hypothetical protein